MICKYWSEIWLYNLIRFLMHYYIWGGRIDNSKLAKFKDLINSSESFYGIGASFYGIGASLRDWKKELSPKWAKMCLIWKKEIE
jgi:hypothetical protein